MSVKQVRNIKNSCGFFNLALDFFLRHLAELEAERHIVENGHVRVKSVVLEHHCDVSVLGGNVVYKAVADVKLAFGDFFKTRYHTQRR